jgi:hypothetical protein
MSRILPIVTVSLVAASTLSLAAQRQVATATTSRVVSTTVTRATVVKARENALTIIQGNALNSTNGQLTNVVVRLRDARFGRIVDTQLTDTSGLFAFRAIDPGSYVVELMADDEQSILAASQLLNVNAGEAVSAVVKLPFRISPFAGATGSTSTASAILVATQAAASSVVALVPTTSVSPNQ